MNESEKRVKEVWPDAKVICGPENCNGHQIVLPISGDGWGAEFGAWADAASRLPKAENRLCDECEGNVKVLAMCGDCNGTGYAIAPPAKEPAPQTFKEWWISKESPSSEGIHSLIGASYEAVHDNLKNWLESAWNAAKASSPATVPRDIAHTLWNEGGRLRTELAASLEMHPENWHQEGLQQRIAEWDKAAERYFDYAFSGTVSSPAVAGRESETEELYYIQDTRQFVGNSVMWWKPDGHGYTSDLKQAWKVTETKAKAMHRSRSTDVPWACSDIDSASQRHFDMQNLRNFQPLIKDVRGTDAESK